MTAPAGHAANHADPSAALTQRGTASLKVGDRTIELPVVEGSEGYLEWLADSVK